MTDTRENVNLVQAKQAKVIELVIFRPKAGVSNEQLTKAAERLTPVLAQMDAFVSRSLAVDSEGEWCDIVYWTSKQGALEAAKKVMEIEECKPFFDMIDFNGMKMTHKDIVA